nr:hypothetical protein [Tanacetum cinerariifolium]
SRDIISDENRFSSIPRPKVVVQNLEESQRDDHSHNIPSEIPEPQKKEAIDDEIGSIMKNNTWVISDLPHGCKPLGFRQKEGIDYFDTYAPVVRIATIRLLLALVAIHNLIIHQMDVKTTFLNGDLDEEVYMKQPKGFVMPGNEHKCVYSKFDNSDKGVIICLYVDDMLIFKTDQNQVDKTKKFLSSRFPMKDMEEADVILGIKIKRDNKGIVIKQSHYIEKILKKFNREDCSPVSTPMNLLEKLKPNTRKPVDKLEYSRAIGCLMYAMTSTRLDIAYVVGRLNRFTSNPSRQHLKVIIRVFKYLRGTKDYGLSYVGYPSMLEGVIGSDFMQLSLEVIVKLKKEIRMEENKVKKIEKITRFKPGLLGQSGSLGVDFSNMEMIENDWELESKKVSFLGRGLNSPLGEKKHKRLYLMRRSLEVLIKFRERIIGGRYNQLSHISSPLLSKPGEY